MIVGGGGGVFYVSVLSKTFKRKDLNTNSAAYIVKNYFKFDGLLQSEPYALDYFTSHTVTMGHLV